MSTRPIEALFLFPFQPITSVVSHIFVDLVKDEAWAVPLRRYLKKSSTESHGDQNFKGTGPGVHPGGYASGLIAECIACLERTAS